MSLRSPAATGSGTGGAFIAPDGSPAAPGYAFAGSTSTGWYRTTAPDVRLAIGGFYAYAFTTTQFLPTSAGGNDLGSPALSWKRIYLDFTNTATIGAVTINKAAGRVNVAAAATSVVVTNSYVTAASLVLAVVAQADATAIVKNVVAGVGSFTINLNAAATANCAVNFFVINTDA